MIENLDPQRKIMSTVIDIQHIPVHGITRDYLLRLDEALAIAIESRKKAK